MEEDRSKTFETVSTNYQLNSFPILFGDNHYAMFKTRTTYTINLFPMQTFWLRQYFKNFDLWGCSQTPYLSQNTTSPFILLIQDISIYVQDGELNCLFLLFQEQEKKEWIIELDYRELKNRRRTLGNIRFIGELFKLKVCCIFSIIPVVQLMHMNSLSNDAYEFFE